MDLDNKNITVGDIVTDIPESMGYFKQIGIDYCCGGYRLLSTAVKEIKLDINTVIDHLKYLRSKQIKTLNKVDFKTMTSEMLIHYIVEKHHNYLKNTLPTILSKFNAVIRAHGAHHPELFDIYKLFGTLQTDLNQHIIKEETIVFPAIIENNSYQNYIEMIKEEHIEAGEILLKIRILTNNYYLPEDACQTYKQLFILLEELENDTHTHVHLENNILLRTLFI